jgi:O-antigen ligase
MKWLVLAVCLSLVLPLSEVFRRDERVARFGWALVGFLPFVIQYLHLYMAVDSAAMWGGYVKGAEVSLLDILALALYLATPGTKERLPFRGAMALYFCMVLLSCFHAWQPKLALFYPWQLLRMFLVYAAVVRGSANLRVVAAILAGMAGGILMEAGLAIWQRFAVGMIQTAGTVGHQNLLGVMSHLVMLPFFALLLGRRGKTPRIVGFLAVGAFVVVSTASRGTIGVEVIALTLVALISASGRWTTWKGKVLGMATLAMVVLVPAAVSTFQERFAITPLEEGTYDDRTAYIKAASMMLAEHPLGVGANHFAVIGNIEHYYERAGVQTYALALAGNVHNFYYLTAAETGYPGLIALLIFLANPVIAAIRCGRRNLGEYRGDLLLGLGVGLFAVYLHSWVEWSLATFSAEYLVAIAIGLVAGNAQQLGYWMTSSRTRTHASLSVQTSNASRAGSSSSERARRFPSTSANQANWSAV